MDTGNITYLIEIYAQRLQISCWRVSFLVANDGKFYKRLKNGGGCTIATYHRVLQWLSDHWPSDLTWPAEIERPVPSPDSPVGKALSPAATPPITLNHQGRIANPAVLCERLGVKLNHYYQATSQYAAGKARGGRMPRRGSDLRVLVAALALVGDVRFVHRREWIQASLPLNQQLSQRLAVLPEVA